MRASKFARNREFPTQLNQQQRKIDMATQFIASKTLAPKPDKESKGRKSCNSISPVKRDANSRMKP